MVSLGQSPLVVGSSWLLVIMVFILCDYIVFTFPCLVKSAELSGIGFFKLLGWIFAEEGRKGKPFDSTCETLGAVFDLSESVNDYQCKVSNTTSRVDEISTGIAKLLESGHIVQHDAQKLRGRMQFAESQIYGRRKRCINCLREFASHRRTKITDRDAVFLKLFVSLLKAE